MKTLTLTLTIFLSTLTSADEAGARAKVALAQQRYKAKTELYSYGYAAKAEFYWAATQYEVALAEQVHAPASHIAALYVRYYEWHYNEIKNKRAFPKYEQERIKIMLDLYKARAARNIKPLKPLTV